MRRAAAKVRDTRAEGLLLSQKDARFFDFNHLLGQQALFTRKLDSDSSNLLELKIVFFTL
jgi:hypothetical protein